MTKKGKSKVVYETESGPISAMGGDISLQPREELLLRLGLGRRLLLEISEWPPDHRAEGAIKQLEAQIHQLEEELSKRGPFKVEDQSAPAQGIQVKLATLMMKSEL